MTRVMAELAGKWVVRLGLRRNGRSSSRKTAVVAGIALVAAQTTACYTYVPRYGTTPSPGEQVALVITDQGRVALSDRMGTGVLRVAGRVVETQGDDYVVAVTEVRQVDDKVSHWTGERVNIRRDWVGGVEARQFSRGRTTTAVVAVVAGLAILTLAASLAGFGFIGPDSGGGTGGQQ